MSDTAWYVIAYDIRDPQRLRRVQRLLRSCGYTLQESVFAWEGDHRQLADLKQQLLRLIRENEDDVRGYPMLAGHDILWWGALVLPLGIVDESSPRIDRQTRFTEDD